MAHRVQLSINDPESELLKALVREGRGPFEAICRLAGLHSGADDHSEILRSDAVAVGGRVFPPAQDVPALLFAALKRVNELFETSQHPADDLRVACFAASCILEIHPFTNGNGRVALGFVQYLLMQRWGRVRPPFTTEKTDHQDIGRILRRHLETEVDCADDLLALSEDVLTHIASSTLETLRATESIADLASCFEDALRPDP